MCSAKTSLSIPARLASARISQSQQYRIYQRHNTTKTHTLPSLPPLRPSPAARRRQAQPLPQVYQRRSSHAYIAEQSDSGGGMSV